MQTTADDPTPNEPTASTIFLVDDHPAVREGLSLILQASGHTVLGGAKNIAEAKTKLSELTETPTPFHHCIVIVDLSLGEESGLTLIPWLCQHQYPVLIYSMHENADLIESCLDAGATGYVSKRELGSTLNDAIKALQHKERYLSPAAITALQHNKNKLLTLAHGTELSEREAQILNRLGLGESLPEIAERYQVSHRTIETYCHRIMAKHNITGMKALRRLAIAKKTLR